MDVPPSPAASGHRVSDCDGLVTPATMLARNTLLRDKAPAGANPPTAAGANAVRAAGGLCLASTLFCPVTEAAWLCGSSSVPVRQRGIPIVSLVSTTVRGSEAWASQVLSVLSLSHLERERMC